MRYVGYHEYFHDANLAIIDEDGTLVYASAAERYSGKKYDAIMYPNMWKHVRDNDHVQFAFQSRPNDLNQILFDFTNFDSLSPRMESIQIIPSHLQYDDWNYHHLSHCENGMSTRPWTSTDDTVIVTNDGCGEIESVTIRDKDMNVVKQTLWPTSLCHIYHLVTIGLGYGFSEEYIVMGLAAYGEPNQKYIDYLRDMLHYFETEEGKEVSGTLYDDGGVPVWKDSETVYACRGYLKAKCQLWTERQLYNGEKPENIAASLQKFFEEETMKLMREARKYGSKLVYGGGGAQNVVANSLIYQLFDEVHIPTAPHDGGNGLGAAAHAWKTHTGGTHIKWSPYSGHDIERDIDPKEVARYLVDNKVCGVANGKAEYGPRALGNRSLIADVRYDVKDTVNDIKRRQRFRPFAPAILSEFAEDYFDGPMSEYMQYAAKAKHDYKSVTHVDGTARVQLVKPDCESKIRQILEEYYELTGVPMILNTSLNVRGKPIVNTIDDAIEWEQKYNVRVF